MTDFAILSQNVGAELRLRQSDCDLRSENKILSWWDWKCYLSEFERVWIAICWYLLPAPSSGGSVQVLSVRPSSPLAAVNTFQILPFHWVIFARKSLPILPICIIDCRVGNGCTALFSLVKVWSEFIYCIGLWEANTDTDHSFSFSNLHFLSIDSIRWQSTASSRRNVIYRLHPEPRTQFAGYWLTHNPHLPPPGFVSGNLLEWKQRRDKQHNPLTGAVSRLLVSSPSSPAGCTSISDISLTRTQSPYFTLYF